MVIVFIVLSFQGASPDLRLACRDDGKLKPRKMSAFPKWF